MRLGWLRNLSALSITAATALLGCGDESDTGTGSGSGAGGETTSTSASTAASTGGAGGSGTGGMATGATGGMGTGGGGTIPDPGNMPANEWPDTEPNDDPSHAVPVGVLQFAFWMGFSDPPSAISSPTDKDYYVFKTGPDAMSLDVNLQICWSFAGNLLDLSLYEVVGGTQGALVASAKTTTTGCETLIGAGQGPTLLKTSTVYLLEVVAGPGLNLGGDPGLYNA